MRISKEVLFQLFVGTLRLRQENRFQDDTIRQLIANHFKYLPNRKLYKYRSCNEENFLILEEKCIWMAPPSGFCENDDEDSMIHIDRKKVEIEMKQWCDENPKQLKSFFKTLFIEGGKIPYSTKVDRKIDDYLEELKDSFIQTAISRIDERDNRLVYCMTEDPNNPQMWDEYADCETGFCIEYCFSDERLDQLQTNEYINLIYLFPVVYSDEQESFDLKSFLVQLATKKERDPLLDATLNMNLFSKRKQYEFEKEWRFMIRDRGNNKQFFPFISSIISGKRISEDGFLRLKEIAKNLGVPLIQFS